MTHILPFFIVLIAGLFFSGFLKRFKIPWVITLIVAGILIGPHGFEIVTIDSTLSFLGDVGLIFLMFMAGLEINFSQLSDKHSSGIWIIALINGFVPAAMGVIIGLSFGYSVLASLLIGSILMSSSVAVIIPILEQKKLHKQKLGAWILGSTAIQDIVSLIFLAAILHIASDVSAMPLWLFYIIAGLAFIAIRFGIVFIWKWYMKLRQARDGFEMEMRTILAILLASVLIFELVGLHGIIAGFFAGVILSDYVTHKKILDKLHTLAYGIFIPVFFVTVGMRFDLLVFTQVQGLLLLALVVIGASVLSKYVSGYLGGLVSGLSTTESQIMGATSIPQLSTTLAAVFAGYELGIIGDEMIVVMTLLTIVTTFVSPVLIEYFFSKMDVNDSDLLNEKLITDQKIESEHEEKILTPTDEG